MGAKDGSHVYAFPEASVNTLTVPATDDDVLQHSSDFGLLKLSGAHSMKTLRSRWRIGAFSEF